MRERGGLKSSYPKRQETGYQGQNSQNSVIIGKEENAAEMLEIIGTEKWAVRAGEERSLESQAVIFT